MPAPVQIFLAWCLLLPAFCGLGLLASRVVPDDPERIGWPLAFWLGLATSAPLLAAWHLALPIDGRVWILLAPLGAAGLALERRDLVRTLRGRAPSLLSLAAFACWLATRAALSSDTYDDGLYFTQTVRWNSLYAAVPGLGNLHPFLAFNHAFHLWVAALGVGPFTLHGQHLANGLVLLVAIAPCLASLGRVLDPRCQPKAGDFFAAMLIGLPLDASLGGGLSAPAADPAVAMAGVGLLVAALGPALNGLRSRQRHTFAIVASCGGALIIKPSILCVAAPAVLVALSRWLRTSPERRQRLLLGAILSAAAACVAAPWMARSLVLSGYLVFPAPSLSVHVDWRMDRATVVSIYRWVHAFARWAGHSYEEVTASSAWVGKWFGREWLNDRTFLLPATLAVSAALALGVLLGKGKRPQFAILASTAAVGLGLGIWWMLAPDLRFAGPLPWAFAALLLLGVASALRPALDGPARVALAFIALAIAWGAFLGSPPLFVWEHDFPPLRHDPLEGPTGRLASGEMVRLPTHGACWDPPCALPPVNPYLRLRRPGDWASGFTIAPLPKASVPAPR